jgi:nucleoside-diphosphate-sugar epimerase|tara:strand:+ start:1828 stop:2775 length:948 start_codon:yes stop_codon:yes gene_type:complete
MVKKKILVTGGAGYVGTALLPKLLEAGHEVTVFDNLMQGGNQLLSFFRNKNFHFVNGDVTIKNDLAEAVKGMDVIVHLAAIVGFPACKNNPELATAVNVDGTQNLIDVTTPEQIILYGSTGSNYGKVTDICTEESPLNPLSLYGETKTQAEHMLMARGNTVAYRFATAFGVSPRLRLDLLINDFTNKCLRDGYLVVYEKHFMRTFIHVSDMANAFMLAINNLDRMVDNVYNIGDDSMNYSKEEICNMVAEKTDAFIHFEEIGSDADKRNYVVSYDKVRALGFRTEVTIQDGIDEIIKALNVVDFTNPYVNIKRGL